MSSLALGFLVMMALGISYGTILSKGKIKQFHNGLHEICFNYGKCPDTTRTMASESFVVVEMCIVTEIKKRRN